MQNPVIKGTFFNHQNPTLYFPINFPKGKKNKISKGDKFMKKSSEIRYPKSVRKRPVGAVIERWKTDPGAPGLKT